MLVLNRKEGQAIDLTLPDGRTVTVAVVEIRGSQVKIGIEAPIDVRITRPDHQIARAAELWTGGKP